MRTLSPRGSHGLLGDTGPLSPPPPCLRKSQVGAVFLLSFVRKWDSAFQSWDVNSASPGCLLSGGVSALNRDLNTKHPLCRAGGAGSQLLPGE